MASWEETVRPNFDVAVSHVTELIREASILDKLLAKNVLTFSQYDDMLRSAKSDPKHAARLLLMSLKLSTTKLDTFLAILPYVEGGKELHSALTTSDVLSEEKETVSRTAKEDTQPSLASMIAKKVLHELAPHQSDVSNDIGQMADPKWKQILNPVQSDAVTLAADLLTPTSLFLDKLAEKECLTDSQTEKIGRLRREHGPIEAARELFDKLKKQPSPSFDTFCMILLDVKRGKDLYDLLTSDVKPPELVSGMTSVAVGRQEEPSGAAAVPACSGNIQEGEEVINPPNPDTERHLSSKDEPALSDKIKTSIHDSPEMLHSTQVPGGLDSSNKKKFLKKESVLGADVTNSVDGSPKGLCSKKDGSLEPPIGRRDDVKTSVNSSSKVPHVNSLDLDTKQKEAVLGTESKTEQPNRSDTTLDSHPSVKSTIATKENRQLAPHYMRVLVGQQRRRTSSSTAEVQPPMHRSHVSDVGQAASVAGRRVKLRTSSDDSRKALHGTTEGKGFQKEEEITAMINSFILLAKEKSDVMANLGKKTEDILEIIQQGPAADRFTPEQLSQIRRHQNRRQTGAVLLACLGGASEKVKVGFACAVVAVSLADQVFPPALYNEVLIRELQEYMKIGGGRMEKAAFEQSFKNLLSSYKSKGKKDVVLVLVGKTGTGKSTFISSLLGEEIAEIGDGMECGTKVAQKYVLKTSSEIPVDLVVWNTPGLASEDTEAKIGQTLSFIKEIDLLVICVEAVNPRLKAEVSKFISAINENFRGDSSVWEHCLFVLTKANLLRDPGFSTAERDEVVHFEKVVSSITKGCRYLLEMHKVKSASKIPFVPVGSFQDKVLANGQAWLPEFWTTAIARATDAGTAFSLRTKSFSLETCAFGNARAKSNYETSCRLC